MDPTQAALALLDQLERNDVAGIEASARALRSAHVALRSDGLELTERAVALDRPEALRALLVLGASDHSDALFGTSCPGFLARLAAACFDSGRTRPLLELLARGAPVAQLGHDARAVDDVARAAIVEHPLDDETAVAVAAACGTNRGAFLVHALHAARMSLVERLAPTCTSRQSHGADRLGDVPLVAAADAGATAALRMLVGAGAKPNVALRDSGAPLHHAIRCDRLASAERAELVHELLRLGSVPELRDPSGTDAYALAEARRDADVVRVLRDHGWAYGPRQSREARRHGIRDLCLHYDKADGLVYRIGQPDVTFLDGGDYDGPGPCTIEQFRASFDRVRERRPQLPLGWFDPFLARLERGEELGYDELLARAPGLRLVRFDQTSNWSQMVD